MNLISQLFLGPVYTIPDHLRIGYLFISYWPVCVFLLCMNPIRSAPTMRYNSASHQQVVRKWIRYNLYRFLSPVNIVIRYETLPNFPLIRGWLQCKWGWSIAWQIGKENNKYGICNEIILARSSVSGLFSRLVRVNTRSPERFLYRIQESDPAWQVMRYRVNQALVCSPVTHRVNSKLYIVNL